MERLVLDEYDGHNAGKVISLYYIKTLQANKYKYRAFETIYIERTTITNLVTTSIVLIIL